MQTGPVTEGLSAALWASEVMCEPVASELESLNIQCDLGYGSSACSLGLFLKGPDSIHGGPCGLLQPFSFAIVV